MKEDLRQLLKVTESDVNGLLEEFKPSNTFDESDISLTFHYIRFRNNLPRIDNFISKLCDLIISFCLSRDKYSEISHDQVRSLYLEAKRKFAEPANNRSGEPGELIIFYLLEGYMQAPQIMSKMSLKTNQQMHVHGADGVHMDLEGENIQLYFGESKLYKSYTAAVTDAIDSVKNFVEPIENKGTYTQRNYEISILSNNLDIPAGRLRDLVIKTLDPYQKEHSNLNYVHACFIGFDLEEIKESCDKQAFINIYEEKAKSCYKNVKKKIESDPELKKLQWHFFFMPFDSVEEFRQKFFNELKQ